MNHSIENSIIKVVINSKGAELQSVYHKDFEQEYMWSGDANFWGKKSPVLFPIVGGLKDNVYEFDEKKYTLPRHGFARDNEFSVHQISDTVIAFTFSSNDATKTVYPFDFAFTIEYALVENKLSCTYKVINTGNIDLLFSVGAHPAFAIPLTNDTNFNDWKLSFEKSETCGIYPLTKDGLLKAESIPYFDNATSLPLNKELFYGDALVFKNLQSTAIKIYSDKSDRGLTMHYQGFPFFGIWSSKDADFVCLEPWLGVADSENSSGKLLEKEGIISLPSNKEFTATWDIEMF